MTDSVNDINLVLISDKPDRAYLLQELMRDAGVTGVIRRIVPGLNAIQCGQHRGSYCGKPPPNLILYDYSQADTHNTSVLRKIAFGDTKTAVPVVLLTSPESQAKLDSGDIDGGGAVMFSPTSLTSFVKKLQVERRSSFLKALHTLYEYGPILVRTPAAVLNQDEQQQAISA